MEKHGLLKVNMSRTHSHANHMVAHTRAVHVQTLPGDRWTTVSCSIGFQLLKVNLTHSYSGKFLKIFKNCENFMVQNFNKTKF